MAVNEDLTGFIREALNRGLPRDDIRAALNQADWPEDEVETALRGFAEVEISLAVPRPRRWSSPPPSSCTRHGQWDGK
jgi:hypothetical protein